MNDERTIYRPKGAKKPKLFIISDDMKREVTLSGRQSVGRRSKTSDPAIALPSPVVSRSHGEFITTREGTAFKDTGSANGTFLNGNLLASGNISFLRDGDVLRIHNIEDIDCIYDVIMIYSLSYPDVYFWQELPLDDSIYEVAVGRDEVLSLKEKTVSRRHASFFNAEAGWAVIDHDSLNGVYVNNRKITEPVYIYPMNVIRISDYNFIYTGRSLIFQADEPVDLKGLSSGNAGRVPDGPVLSVRIEEKNVWQRAKKKTLLKDIHMDIPSGSMVLILGGSGAGKTTFMNAVMGYEKAEGNIKYNNTDIYSEYEKMKYEIGYVPQQDLLRMNDNVYDTLMGAAKMRLPASLSHAELENAVEKTIGVLGLDLVRHHLVGKLSGGQRKRLSIAVEYIGNPSLFFLDEPDSGLDGTMARSLMENLREIADDGRIVIVISHAPDRAFELFDKVIVLAKGSDDSGHLVFYGSPDEAVEFFGTSGLEGIVKKVNSVAEGGEGLADHFIQEFEKRGYR